MIKGKLVAITAAAALLGGGAAAVAQITGSVPDAQPRQEGVSLQNIVAPGYSQQEVARGSNPLENPIGQYKWYGYLDDAIPVAQGGSGERTTTEADINTYLKTDQSPGGPTAGYDYGTHFLFQGHENGKNNQNQDDFQAYLTRINLDVTDPAHRITLLNAPDQNGKTGLTRVDGSTWDPSNGEMLFTQEGSGTSTGGVVGTALQWGSGTDMPALHHYDGSIGKGGFEGIHPDGNGNLILAEDIGGSSITDPTDSSAGKAKQPNSFIYRYVPDSADDLTRGKLQALQVSIGGEALAFHGTDGCQDGLGRNAAYDTYGPLILALHSGAEQQAQWVTVHDTATDGTDVFNANVAAKKHCATPFKRPENLNFVPGTDFGSFVFDATGDTGKAAGLNPRAAARASWGALYRADIAAGDTSGTVRTIELGDADHASLDNLTFLDANTLLAGEDRGDSLHKELNKLDSLWSFDISLPLDQVNGDAKRLIAEGRDPQATVDSHHLEAKDVPKFQNDGDNEVTGVTVSDGHVGLGNVQGKHVPSRAARTFFTQQHGQNITYQILSDGARAGRSAR
jgi:secreted PhoX family phosphatase